MKNFSKNVKAVKVLDAVAAGTTNQTGTHVDTEGFDGVCFVAEFGTLTATQVTSLNAQGGAKSDDSDMADLAGTKVGPMADGDSNKMLILDIYKPVFQFIRPVVKRGTANAVINNVIAYLYGADKRPIVNDATVSAAVVVASPAAGTP